MAKKSSDTPPADKLALYENLIATSPGVECKGAKMPYTSMNGQMFSFLTEDGTLALRLPDDNREAFIKKYKTKLCQRHGRVMKEYVVVPAALLKKTTELKTYFKQSVDYVSSLKAKPTKRKKAAKKSTKPTKKNVARKATKKKVAKKAARKKK